MPETPGPSEGLTDILDELAEATGSDAVSVGDIVDRFSYRSCGPWILVPALVVILPTGMVPGVPTVTALCIAPFAGQAMVSRNSPWLPDRIKGMSIPRGRFQ